MSYAALGATCTGWHWNAFTRNWDCTIWSPETGSYPSSPSAGTPTASPGTWRSEEEPSEDTSSEDEWYEEPSSSGSTQQRGGGYSPYPDVGGSTGAPLLGDTMKWFLIAGAVLGVSWLALDVWRAR